MESSNVSKPGNPERPEKPEKPEPIAIRKLDKLETTIHASNPSGA
jgi:hypothetical protein